MNMDSETYMCSQGHTFQAVAHGRFDGPPHHCPECGDLHVAIYEHRDDRLTLKIARAALTEAKDSLDSLWAAIGDALCSGKGIEKAYSNSVARDCRRASDLIADVLRLPDAGKKFGNGMSNEESLGEQ